MFLDKANVPCVWNNPDLGFNKAFSLPAENNTIQINYFYIGYNDPRFPAIL